MSTRTFKALSIVTNVKQGDLVQQLIEENKAMKTQIAEFQEEMDIMGGDGGCLLRRDDSRFVIEYIKLRLEEINNAGETWRQCVRE